jgi:hypothetical protein
MKPDPDYLRRLYAHLSDLELLDTDRADLTETARECYDQELARRPHLSAYHDGDSNHGEDSGFETEDDVGSLPDGELNAREETDHLKPIWYEEGAEVYSTVIYPGRESAREAAEARDVLRDANISCFLEIVDDPSSDGVSPTRRWRLTAPGHLSLRATSVLEIEIFNADFEEQWRVHLEQFSDSELEEMHPRVAFGGLFDRIDRVTRLYKAELSRRGLKSN